MTCQELITFTRSLYRGTPFSDVVLMQWINDLENKIQLEVFLLSIDSTKKHTDVNEILLADDAHNELYWNYLAMMISRANGEWGKYQNNFPIFDQLFDAYKIWYADSYNPAQGDAESKGYYISAYSLAVKYGFSGSEEDWISYISANAQIATEANTQAQAAAERAETAAETAETASQGVVENADRAVEAARQATEAVAGISADAERATQAAAQALLSQNASKASETASEAAKTTAVTASETAVSANTEAQTAKDTAVASANSASEDAETASTAAQTATAAANITVPASQAAVEAKDTAISSASSATQSKENAEAWAVGERNGVPVGAGDETFNNNAKYYKDQAEAIVGGDFATHEEAQGYAMAAGEAAVTAANLYTDGEVEAINVSLGEKADTSAVNNALAQKADTSTVNTALATKADTTYVNTELAKKASTTDLNTAIATRQPTITTTGIIKGNGAGALSPAVSGTDYGHPTLKRTTDPTPETVGAVTQQALNTTTRDMFVCVGVNAGTYTWEKLGGGGTTTEIAVPDATNDLYGLPHDTVLDELLQDGIAKGKTPISSLNSEQYGFPQGANVEQLLSLLSESIVSPDLHVWSEFDVALSTNKNVSLGVFSTATTRRLNYSDALTIENGNVVLSNPIELSFTYSTYSSKLRLLQEKYWIYDNKLYYSTIADNPSRTGSGSTYYIYMYGYEITNLQFVRNTIAYNQPNKYPIHPNLDTNKLYVKEVDGYTKLLNLENQTFAVLGELSATTSTSHRTVSLPFYADIVFIFTKGASLQANDIWSGTNNLLIANHVVLGGYFVSKLKPAYYWYNNANEIVAQLNSNGDILTIMPRLGGTTSNTFSPNALYGTELNYLAIKFPGL